MERKARDFLSDLSDDVLHRIFFFLQINDILKFRVLSKRFSKTLFATTSSFCFSHDSDPKNCSCEHVSDFMINTVLQNRPRALGINRISFSSSCDEEEHGELHKQWIMQLYEAFGVDELSLDYKLPSIFKILPKFQSLKVLKLNMNQRCSVKLRKMGLASVETLHIKSINTDGSFDEWISQCFPSLKHLFLQKLTNYSTKQDFTIRSSTLEDLEIHQCYWFKCVRIISENLRTLNCYFGGDYGDTKFVLETCAPNLQSLSWVPYRFHHYDDKFQNLQLTTAPKLLIMGEPNYCLVGVLCKAIRRARELLIDTETLQALVVELGFEDILLQNLRHLEILVRGNIDCKYCITCVERLSNLETLTLVNYPTNNNPYLEERSVKDKFEEALRECKEVEVRRTRGLEKVKLIIREFNNNMVVVIGWLMKSCTYLEEMNLYYPSCFHNSMMQEGLLYLQQFERASPKPPSFHLFPQT